MEVTEVLKLQAGNNNSLIINKAHVRSSTEIVLVFFLFFFPACFSSALESGRRNINDSDSTLLCDSSADDGWFARGQNGPKVWWRTHKKACVLWKMLGWRSLFLKDFNYLQTTSLFKLFVTFPVIISLSSTDFKFHILIPPNSLHWFFCCFTLQVLWTLTVEHHVPCFNQTSMIQQQVGRSCVCGLLAANTVAGNGCGSSSVSPFWSHFINSPHRSLMMHEEGKFMWWKMYKWKPGGGWVSLKAWAPALTFPSFSLPD